MWHKSTLAAAALCAALLFGCSSQPEKPGILVVTTPPGASCVLSRLGQTIATADPTPAIALADPTADDVTILCRRHGFADEAVTLAARRTEPGFGLMLGRWPFDYEHRVDITLKAKSSRAAPR